ILEWVGDKDSTDTDPSKRKLVVIRKSDNKKNYQVVTNFIVKDGYYDEGDKKYGLDRYELISKVLEDKKGIVSNEQEAMDILRSVGRRNWNNDDENSITTHSVIYNMSKKTVYWIGNEHFDDEKYVYKYEFK
uniref:hypothetical protein n=1 Tax=Histophilus somni TaxID=731 RepID=UPI00201F638A